MELQNTEVLYREHGAAVAALCRSLLRDGTEAEDATQQVFLSAHRALLNGSTPREPLAWLLAVARHECYARYRRRAGSPLPAGDVPDAATPDASVHVLRAGELAAVWDEVGRMPTAQREAFVLREIRGLSYGQLAEELSLSTPSVRSLLLRARTRLRLRLRDVAAGLGGAPWLQPLVRIAAGDGTPSVTAATKAAAVGIGALALVGGGDVARVTHHAWSAHATARHQARTRIPHTAGPAAVAVARGEDRPGRGLPAVAVKGAWVMGCLPRMCRLRVALVPALGCVVAAARLHPWAAASFSRAAISSACRPRRRSAGTVLSANSVARPSWMASAPPPAA